MEIEFKSFNIDLEKAIKIEKGEGSAVIAELNVIDLDGDVTLPGAFGEQHVNIQPAHDRHAPRLGKGVLKEDGGFAIANFKFNLAPEAVTAKEWYSALKFDMKNGMPLQEWSYGFKIVEADFGQFEGREVRFLKRLKVHEISPVLRGAGVGTQTLALKSNMTFKEEMEKAMTSLADVKNLIERAKSLADIRAKENRNLSVDHRNQLQTFKTLLDEVLKDCETVIDQCGDEVDTVVRLQLAYQKTLFENRTLLTG